jgi:hypothetical protein
MGAGKKDEYESDSERFGPVNNVRDLEPETGVGPNIAQHQREKLLEKNDSVGYFEIQGGSKTGLGEPLHVGEWIKKDSAPAVSEYEASYNTYASPLRKTLRAEGRVKDLSMANAPMTPAELEKNPKVANHFKNLSLQGAQDSEMSAWSKSQSQMITNIKRYGGGQHVLAGAVASYDAVQRGLQAKRKEFEKAAKQEEIEKVDQAVETIHKIIDTTAEAWTLSGELDEIIGSQAFDENAEADVIEEPTERHVNWVHGTVDDPTGENTKFKNKGQKVAGAIDAAKLQTAEARKIVGDATAKLAAGQDFSLDIDGILHAVMGGKEYLKLKADVVKLDAQIKSLGLEKESLELTSATEKLHGFRMTFQADREQLKNDRVASRDGARNFAAKVNSGQEGIMAMYVAEAYQELAAFGELASQERHDMNPALGRARRYLNDTSIKRFEANNEVADAKLLAGNIQDAMFARTFFDKHLPEWKSTAKQWNDFLGKNAHHDLVRRNNAADRSEGE